MFSQSFEPSLDGSEGVEVPGQSWTSLDLEAAASPPLTHSARWGQDEQLAHLDWWLRPHLCPLRRWSSQSLSSCT